MSIYQIGIVGADRSSIDIVCGLPFAYSISASLPTPLPKLAFGSALPLPCCGEINTHHR
jgi:hypothetical protein